MSSGVYRLHKCQVRYEILSEGVLPKDFKQIEMSNWTALLGLEQGVKVRHTSRSWIVHIETLYGGSPAELGAMAKSLADRVAKALMLNYGCRLGEGMPERVKALEGKVEALHMDLTELISALKQLFNLESDPEKRQRDQMRADTYRT